MSTDSANPAWGRFKLLGLVVLGLVVGALAVLAGHSWSTVPEAGRKGYVIAITHGPKDPDRVMLALTTATRLPKCDNHVWFAIDGGQVCKKGEAEKVTSPLFTKQENAAKLIEALRAKGVAVHIWPSCAEYYGVKGAVALDGLDEKGPDWLLEKVATHHVLGF